MGKHWLHWIGGGSGSGNGGGGATTHPTTARRMPREAVTSAGCMRAVFHLLDFPVLNQQQQQSNTNLSGLLPHESSSATRGLEEPRNSLAEQSRKEEATFDLPVRIIPIKTGHSSRADQDCFSSESMIDSPGIKTPSVVARLMGLDLLPDSSSPRVSASKPCQDQKPLRNLVHGRSVKALSDDDISVLSMPETPRMSSARRSSSDFEHHRLSLQINKENNAIDGSPLVSRRGRRFRFQQQDENRNPGHYARQIVKQVKESVSRRVGIDITNTTNRQQNLTRRDEHLTILKPTCKKSKSGESSLDRLKFLKTNTNNNGNNKSNSECDNKREQGIKIPVQQPKDNSKKVTTNTSSGIKKLPIQVTRNKKEEAFVHPAPSKTVKKNKKTSILNISSPAITITKLPQEQLPSKESQSYRAKQLGKRLTVKENVLPERNGGYAAAMPGNAAVEYGSYIRTMLKLAGVVDDLDASLSVKWHTASHPIDPLIFHRIEFFHLGAVTGGTAALGRRCNRKLIFQLVDELLADLLKPDLQSRPWISSENRRIPTVDELCRKIDGFPAANCVVLEDIDSLIDKDLQKRHLIGELEEERERIVQEIEDEIVEQLVRETAAMVGQRCGAARGAAGKSRWMSRAAVHVR